MKITVEIDGDEEHKKLLLLQSMRMHSSIQTASYMLEDMMNYGPDAWEKTQEELQDVIDILNVFLLDGK